MDEPKIDWRAAYERTVGPAARAKYLETEVARLRERDEAAKAVVRTWMFRVSEAGTNQEAADELTAALDALARAHETGGAHHDLDDVLREAGIDPDAPEVS
jgi:hypothetical protein